MQNQVFSAPAGPDHPAWMVDFDASARAQLSAEHEGDLCALWLDDGSLTIGTPEARIGGGFYIVGFAGRANVHACDDTSACRVTNIVPGKTARRGLAIAA